MNEGVVLRVRADFGRLCEDRGLRIAVEVGSDLGMFAKQLLDTSPSLFLYCIDPWQPYSEIAHERESGRQQFVATMLPYLGRVVPIQLPSHFGAAILKQLGIVPEFIYIDGAHDARNVRIDLETWYSILSPGGLFAGHDWDLISVRHTVAIWAADNDLPIHILHEYGDSNRKDINGCWAHPSWYIWKP